MPSSYVDLQSRSEQRFSASTLTTMKPLGRLAPQCLRYIGLSSRRRTCIRIRDATCFSRSLATLPPDPSERNPPTQSSGSDSQPPLAQDNVPPTTLHQPTPPPQAYPSAPKHVPSERVPISSSDWSKLEQDLASVPETNWFDNDGPVPLNKDYPLTRSDFENLDPDEKARLAYQDWQRKQLDFIRQEKLHDHNHLHPLGTPFVMPMVSYHRNYNPEGTTPPPVPEIPWQLRRPWSWIKKGAVGLLAGAMLASAVAVIVMYKDSWSLKKLEARNPAPATWNEKAKGYYAVALHHKQEGELQLAIWALQRGLVEAGYLWIIDPSKVSENTRLPLDLHDAWVVRMLLLWEIEAEHWDNALSLMEGLSTAYEADDPLNDARRSDLLRIVAIPTEKTKGVQAADKVYQMAISYAGMNLPKNKKETIELPDNMQGHALLLRTLEEYMIFQIKHGLKTAKQALPTLLSIAKVYRNTPPSVRDICGEGEVMLHIGEIMYALGHVDESLQWTERAVSATRRVINEQATEEDRLRCSECVGNGCNSLGILYEVYLSGKSINGQERGDYEKSLEAFKMAIDVAIEAKRQGDVTRAANHFRRVANKLREHEEKLALLEGRGMRLSRG